ncbi:MAG: branched-chain amino acid ABC transporter permease [Pseudomonadota bacterium]
MVTLASVIVDGLAYAMVLFVVCVGLSVTMGLMKVVNLAHGAFALLGGVFVHVLAADHALPPTLAIALAVVAVAAIAALLEPVVFRRLYGADPLRQVLATIALVFLAVASVNAWQGSAILAVPLPEALSGRLDLGFRTLPVHRAFVIVAGLFLFVALYALVRLTRWGVRVRAAVDDPATAESLGLNTATLKLVAFAGGAALAAFGGIFGAEILPVDAAYPLRTIALYLTVVALGGLGNVPGTMLAALGLGFAETFARFAAPTAAPLVVFGAIALALLARPHGLGQR